MRPNSRSYFLALAIAVASASAFAQSISPSADRVIRMSGVVPVAAGASSGAPTAVEFSIFDQESGGVLLWQETQVLPLDGQGGYSVLLGATSADGLPADLFAGGAARWLRVRRSGDADARRTRLTAVPYALSAANADTLGGRPATDFMLVPSVRSTGAGDGAETAATDNANRAPAPLVSNGTAGFIGKFVNTVDLDNSLLFQSGSNVGVGTTTPLDALHTRFLNTAGSATGYAVQNLGSTATSYSGMLFYDHTGALRQFQGYSNGTGEYRINNISPTASINFLIGGDSKFKVATDGKVGIGNASPESALHIGNGGDPILKIDGEANSSTTGSRLRWTETFSSDYGFEAFADGFNDRLVFRGLENNAVTSDNLLVIERLGSRNVGIGVAAPADKLQVAGDIRVGTGTTGCVRDADATVIAGTCSSDLRFKRDVTAFAPLLDRFSRLAPVNYFWRSAEFPAKHFGTRSSWGLIAQDVAQVFPEMVTTDEQGYLAVNYSKLPLLTVQAVKELKAENDTLKAQNAALESRLAALELRLQSLVAAWQQR